MPQLKPVMKAFNDYIVPFNHPHIHYPQLASQKFDGNRMLNLCGESLVTPSLKDVANKNVRQHLDLLLRWCTEMRMVTDGELWSPDIPFERIGGILRSYSQPIPPSLKYYIFDMMTEAEWDNGTEKPYIQRYFDTQQQLTGFDNIVQVPHIMIETAADAEALFNQHIEAGNEGIILRAPNVRYKHGRTTEKQDGMWKFKEFQTEDGVIVAVEEGEQMRDGIERTTDELGHLERTHKQEHYEPSGMVGAFEVVSKGIKFKVKPGRGWNNEAKLSAWSEYKITSALYIGRHCEFRHMPHGAKDKPRIGSLVRMRPDLD